MCISFGHEIFPFLPPANEVCEGYVVTRVCLSTGGGVPGQVPPGPGTPPGTRYTPRPDTPPGRYPTGTRYTHPLGPGSPPGPGTSPWDQVYPPGRYPQTRYTPLGRYTSPQTRYTPQYQVHSLAQVHPHPHPPRTRYTPESSACWEIRATSGWYASFWNGLLSIFCLQNVFAQLMPECTLG